MYISSMDTNNQKLKLIENLTFLSSVWEFSHVLIASIEANEVPDTEIQELYQIVSDACADGLQQIQTEKIQELDLQVKTLQAREETSRKADNTKSQKLLLSL